MSIHRGFPALSQDDVRIARPGRVTIAANPMARLNGQHERLAGAAAPGIGRPAYRYHDHGLNGGAPLGRGTIYSLDVGGIGNGGELRHTLAASATWESMIGALSREFVFPAYVSPGLASTLACVLVVRTFGDIIDIRLTNLETGTSSSAATSAATSNAQQLSIADIPMAPGQYNRFDVEIKSGTSGDALDLLALCLYEDTVTHPASPGTTTYTGL